ncbi:MAG: sensor histidine kinase [Solirubrobacteraceae bacterium]
MRARPRRGALGLRGRIIGALLVTTVATLAVAALALLGPLEKQLRNSALRSVARDVTQATSSFGNLDLADAQSNKIQRDKLNRAAGALAGRIGTAQVYVFAYPLVQLTTYSEDVERSDRFDDVTSAFQSTVLPRRGKAHPIESFGTGETTAVARVAMPFFSGHVAYVLAVREGIQDLNPAVGVVRTAFITAALAGLVLTLILGIPLAATLVRRLRRLRQAALRLAQEGPAADVPVDRARDEVGDLTRTFATMQRRLQQQEEARRAFVATASHELRTPLTSLEGMLELLEDDLRGGEPDLEDARALVERARAQSRRLGRLAADLLDLSRIDAEVQLRSEPVELGELSRAVLAEFELGSAELGVACVLDDTRGPVWALGDPGSVARILRILLDNALRASPEGVQISVELLDAPGASLRVRDLGPGVRHEERELIFERFQRGRDTGGQAGFGLGLAIGRELARRMGGELGLEDVQEVGASFVLRLPPRPARDRDSVPLATHDE